MLRISNRIAIGAKAKLATLLKLLSFTCAENQTAVGTINEPLAIGFTILSGGTIFNISNTGAITFKSAPDFETQSLYILEVKSDRGKRYKITVNVTDALSLFALNTNTVLNLATAI